MNENTLGLLDCLFDEVEDGVGGLVLLIEDHLVVLIQPEKGEISHSNWLKVVWDLLTSAVDNMSDLVGNHEFNVLRCVFVTDKQPILDLDGSDHVHLDGPELLLLLLLLLLLELLLMLIARSTVIIIHTCFIDLRILF